MGTSDVVGKGPTPLRVIGRFAVETVLAKWGNRLGVRIPKGMAADAGLDAGDAVSITPSAEGIVIKKAQPKPQYRLADLVSRITDENRHEATDWGQPKGREIW